MQTSAEFFNLYNHGFIRVAVGIPELRVADPAFNAARTVELMEQAWREKAVLILFPELGLSAYACDDLFHQQALLEGALEALQTVQQASAALPLVTVVGLPLQIDHLLFNCAVVLYRGRILGVIPKTFLPNYREFYELRQFAPAAAATRDTITLCGQTDVPFGERLMFRAGPEACCTFFVEICEDLWVPIPPSCHAALAGATVLLNLSASNITIGKEEYRHSLVSNQSARCLAAYLYTAAGTGESTTDLAWDGHAIIYENGALLAESARFQYTSQLCWPILTCNACPRSACARRVLIRVYNSTATSYASFGTSASRWNSPRPSACCVSVSMIGSRSCRATRQCATAGVTKRTTSRSRGW